MPWWIYALLGAIIVLGVAVGLYLNHLVNQHKRRYASRRPRRRPMPQDTQQAYRSPQPTRWLPPREIDMDIIYAIKDMYYSGTRASSIVQAVRTGIDHDHSGSEDPPRWPFDKAQAMYNKYYARALEKYGKSRRTS